MGWMDQVPLWDHHCHALLKETERANLEGLARCLTEAPGSYPLTDVKNSVVYREALAVAAQEMGIRPVEEELVPALEAVDYAAYCRNLFRTAGYRRLYVDTGYAPADSWSLAEMESILGLPIHAVLRLETVAEQLLGTTDRFDEWIGQFKATIAQARQAGYRGAKSIIAYRSGLDVKPVTAKTAEDRYAAMRRAGQSRLQDRDLLNYLLYQATPLLMAQNLPLQFHTGYGDPDTDLLKGNPLMLRAYLETFVPEGHQVVLLHTYPYQREAGYLTSVYPGVFADVSLAIPLAASGTRRILHELLELAPLSRVLFASDSHSRPESYYLGARAFKEAMNQFLDEAVSRHRVLPSVAEDWALMAGFRNTERLYGV